MTEEMKHRKNRLKNKKNGNKYVKILLCLSLSKHFM